MVHIFSLRSPEAFYRVIFLRLTFKVCQFLRLTAIGFKPYSGPRNWKKVKEKLNIACELKKKKKGKRTRKWNCFATPVCRDHAWHNPNSEVAFVILPLRHRSFIIALERRGEGWGGYWLWDDKSHSIAPTRLCFIPVIPQHWQLIGSQFSIVTQNSPAPDPRSPISDPRPSTPSLTPSLAARWQIIFYSPPFILCRRRLFSLILLPQR